MRTLVRINKQGPHGGPYRYFTEIVRSTAPDILERTRLLPGEVVEIAGPCRIVHDPGNVPEGMADDATVWIETDSEVHVEV